MTVELLIATWGSVTGIVAMVVPSPFLRMIEPVPALIDSVKVRTRLEPMATAVALSAGVDDESVGAVVSGAVRAKTHGLAPPPLTYCDIDVPEAPPLLAMGG